MTDHLPYALGAGYVAAVLHKDSALRQSYVEALSQEELLSVIDTQLLIMARRLAVDSGRTLAEVADTMLGAATMFDRVKQQTFDQLNEEHTG